MDFPNDTAEAMHRCAAACELDPDDPEAWNQLEHSQHRVGDLDAAIASYKKVLALGNCTADKEWIAIATGNLGIVYKTRGDLARAEEMYRRTLAITEELGRKQGMASDYADLGILPEEKADMAAACTHWRKARDLRCESDNPGEVEKLGGWLAE